MQDLGLSIADLVSDELASIMIPLLQRHGGSFSISAYLFENREDRLTI